MLGSGVLGLAVERYICFALPMQQLTSKQAQARVLPEAGVTNAQLDSDMLGCW